MRDRRWPASALAAAGWILIAAAVLARGREVAGLSVRDVGESYDAKQVEIRGVAAGPFDPAIWQAGTLNLLPDIRRPMLEPREGKHRNIYAPSIVQVDGGWRIYYGGWDGTDTPNDRIYLAETRDGFLTFTDRRTIIEHGEFQHVCNVNVTPTGRGYAMMCTAYPDAKGLNKPVTFFSADGVQWKDEAAKPTKDRIIQLGGYPNFVDAADVNGVSVLLFEDSHYRMYFSDFRAFEKVWRASSDDGRSFRVDGKVLDGFGMVNDVKVLRSASGGATWYLMGLHVNGDRLLFSLSQDGMKFPAARVLCKSVEDADRYMVAVGWVTSGQDRVLGLLYGAGSTPSLDANRIFARWLQKKAMLHSAGKAIEPQGALGPDRQVFVARAPLQTKIDLLGEDGRTLIARSAGEIELRPGRAYQISVDRVDRAAPAAAGKSP